MQIYKTTNKINGLIYVGKEGRSSRKYCGSGRLIVEAIKEFGIENFEKQVLEKCSSKEELNEREIYWIRFFDCLYPNGYNISAGGIGGDVFSHNPYSQDIKDNLSEKTKIRLKDKNNNPFYGKEHSEESKKLISLANSNYWKTNGHDYESCMCASCKSKRGDAKREDNGMYGRNHTEESKKKMSIANSGKRKGKDSHTYKPVSQEDRKKIFEMKACGYTINQIRLFFNLSFRKIKRIINGEDV